MCVHAYNNIIHKHIYSWLHKDAHLHYYQISKQYAKKKKGYKYAKEEIKAIDWSSKYADTHYIIPAAWWLEPFLQKWGWVNQLIKQSLTDWLIDKICTGIMLKLIQY